MWPGLPRNLTHVDAVYERPDHKIAIFVGMSYIYTFLKSLIVMSNFYCINRILFLGKQLYLFDSQYLIQGYPKSLAQLGLPESLEKLDAAMIWGHNGKTYFYSGSMYWK